jgi:hypothetical protein
MPNVIGTKASTTILFLWSFDGSFPRKEAGGVAGIGAFLIKATAHQCTIKNVG